MHAVYPDCSFTGAFFFFLENPPHTKTKQNKTFVRIKIKVHTRLLNRHTTALVAMRSPCG